MYDKRVRELELQAAKIRKAGLEAIKSANSGHIGGSFSIADILSVLYFEKMYIDPKNPRMEDRDRFVLSKGHCTPTTYAALAYRGFFPLEDLKTFRNIDSYLSGHIEMNHVPGVDMSAGSLGQGLSVAAGMALSAKTYKKDNRVFVITGDGEIEEGQIWEAAMAAGNFHLDNLIAFIDNNKLQLDGSVSEIMSSEPINEKFRAFGWNVIEIDGHNIREIADAIDFATEYKGKPSLILAHTVKGKGVSIFENGVKWHGSIPTDEEYEIAFNELNVRIAELEVES
jgi:transketolase